LRLNKIGQGLSAALVLLLAVAGVPALMIGIGAVPTSVPSLDQVRQSLLSPDPNMAVLFAVLAGVVWFCWAAFTLATAREIWAAIATRGRRGARPLPKLDWVGRPAAQLVAAVVLVFVTAPILINVSAPTATAAPLVATATLGATRTTRNLDQRTQPALANAAAIYTVSSRSAVAAKVATASRRSPKSATYTVRRRDTLWSIAATQLGDPLRWPELAKLNPGVVGPAPDFLITAGSTLVLANTNNHGPDDSTPQVVDVQTGDTLSGIAASHDAGDWQALWSANQDRPEPGEQVLSDPNHIEPGWTITVPRDNPLVAPAAITPTAVTTGSSARAAEAKTPQVSQPKDPSVTGTGSQTGSPEQESLGDNSASAVAATPSPAQGPIARHGENSTATQEAANPLTSGFAAGGALLAVGVLGALLVTRRRQFRNRRPGRTIAATAPELIPVEKAVISCGRPGLATTEFLDAALRSLSRAIAADPEAQLPDIIALRHGGGQLNLRLSAAHPGPIPAPWTVDDSGLWWSISTEQEIPAAATNASTYLAPLPTLAAIGSDADGHTWLLDLERAGTIALTGDPDRCLDLARFLAAELSVNHWSDALSVTLVGFGEELAGINPARLRYSTNLDAAAVALTVDAVDSIDACTHNTIDARTGRVRDISADTFMPNVLLVAPQPATDSATFAQLFDMATTHKGSSALAIILAGADAPVGEASWTMHLSETGRLTVPELGLDLAANQLPASEALGISQMLSQAAEAADEPMPAATGDQPWQTYSDAAGSLLPEHTLPRTQPGEGTLPILEPFATSLLPFPDLSYLNAAATTIDDLATLAPRVPATVQAAVQEADPTLDQDIEAWLDPDTDLPRLTLLGPVALRAHGQLEKNRVGFYTEIVAYLATRDNGATTAQFETAFNLARTRARSDIRIARNWLGINPRTGRKHLPDALKSVSGRARGVGVYELEDVLVDAELFRRLRVRGQARGADGMADLSAALNLVSGTPFDQLRADGYEWLTEGARIDQHLICAIVDVAHLVTTQALAAGEIHAARLAAEIAQKAAPYEEIPRLDLVAVRAAEGHLEEAEADLRDHVCNRSDDGGAPDDLSERTQTILRQRQWLGRAG
jgi:nucleoid-associated protein YgaU